MSDLFSSEQIKEYLEKRRNKSIEGGLGDVVEDREFDLILRGKLVPRREQVDFIRSVIDPGFPNKIDQLKWVEAWELDSNQCYFRRENPLPDDNGSNGKPNEETNGKSK